MKTKCPDEFAATVPVGQEPIHGLITQLEDAATAGYVMLKIHVTREAPIIFNLVVWTATEFMISSHLKRGVIEVCFHQ